MMRDVRFLIGGVPGWGRWRHQKLVARNAGYPKSRYGVIADRMNP